MELNTYGSWHCLRPLGKGGQGEVFLAIRQHAVEQLPRSIQAMSGTNPDFKRQHVEHILQLLCSMHSDRETPLGALKVLHRQEDLTLEAKALERMKHELAALGKVQHPSLIRLYDSNLEKRWYVMQYFENTLADHLVETKGNLILSLVRFRPLVEAVAALHSVGVVHRDIKPENVFVAKDGRLVLGDCGLAIDVMGDEHRITDTYENVGSRDWMPAWAQTLRLENVTPRFDVFSLGKVLWAMVSGRSKLPFWYHHKPEFELEAMFPESASVRWARRVLDKCIVEEEAECLPDADALLAEIDRVVEARKRPVNPSS